MRKKMFSVDEVVFEFNADNSFVMIEISSPSKMLPFNARFEQMKDLKTAHKIKINSFLDWVAHCRILDPKRGSVEGICFNG